MEEMIRDMFLWRDSQKDEELNSWPVSSFSYLSLMKDKRRNEVYSLIYIYEEQV